MNRITDFEPALKDLLPETHALLSASHLTVHSSVRRVIIHGSRGPAGGCRVDSDVDLSLIVDLPAEAEIETFLMTVTETTLSNWRAKIEADIAVVFDSKACGLKCFDHNEWRDEICAIGGVDCFGLFKVQKGFNGLVTNAGIQVRRMYPCLKIWERR